MNIRVTLRLCGLALVVGCAEEAPPTSARQFLDNPIMLEAAVVRCAQNRSETRYDVECVNVRQAISIIEAKEERARRDAFEAESDRKRQALRRTQQATAEARRRAEEAARQRKEAAYLAQFGELPPREDDSEVDRVVEADARPANAFDSVAPESENSPAVDGGNAPVAEPAPERDLDAVREELRRRNEESGN
jgi:hypothetical protein